jgi:hypothetical protein
MAKQKNRHAHVGALSDAQRAIRREADRAKQRKRSAKLKAQGLKKPMSAVSKANKQLMMRTQLRRINGRRVWVPVQPGPPAVEQLAQVAMESRLMAEEEAAKAAYYQSLHLAQADIHMRAYM